MNLDRFKDKYETLSETLEIPVGSNGAGEVFFKMDTISHVHAFVLGQSGSGKSVFLHNVISGAMLKYPPSCLEFYLLDFKLGGVEFNRYKDEKHVRVMLVDNSDQQVTLEILRELKDRMTERGKLFRKKGVTNIVEYNDVADEKIPHILFVADECHEMFKLSNDTSRAVNLEINEILSKIAKEGRNQGIHLLLATQTLAGADISSDILNNITDTYLLKCSIADSERLVSNSSDKTSALSTGNIFYKYQEQSTIFKAYYADKKTSEMIVSLIEKKAQHEKDNNRFYFKGSAMYHLNEDIVAQYKNRCEKDIITFMGKSVDLKQRDILIPLKEDYSENILIVGLNDEGQSSRVCLNAIYSAILSGQYRKRQTDIIVFDCRNTDEDKYTTILEKLNDDGHINLVRPRDRASIVKNLSEDILAGKETSKLLVIIGQDKFRELKLNNSLDTPKDNGYGNTTEFFGIGQFNNTGTTPKNFSEAIDIILDKGPEYGVHSIVQLDKPSNFLFRDFLNSKEVFQKFKHLILLRSDERAAGQLRLGDDIHLETLDKDEERLRAYYYAEERDSYTLFTPYICDPNLL